ncbi:tRNA (cytidine(34)-2'-O)-methyltransferase [Hankyongella ginsenosidimutans]|uniref:tRNA (cytidine(34)-2'-O)-methyltransferase n=1 Tax=Hankyongella ginsenosidimutans TaxID=1763828 RepID=UPI001CA33593|nr:TrmH family RNA methyltransferase [Hankyongella ginsenosidimutans]
MRLALFQPDQPPNVGTLLRLGACLGVPVDIIEPCGFAFSREAVRRAALDYFDHVDLTAHADYCAFDAARRQAGRRLVLLTSKGDTPYSEGLYTPLDTLVLGQEIAGAPPWLHDAASLRVRIPLKAPLRSLNVAVAAAMVLGEALRQTAAFPEIPELP